MDKLTELLETHRLDLDSSDAVIFGCACSWGWRQIVVTLEAHQEHLAEMLKPLLAEVWDAGATAGWNDNGEPNPYEGKA